MLRWDSLWLLQSKAGKEGKAGEEPWGQQEGWQSIEGAAQGLGTCTGSGYAEGRSLTGVLWESSSTWVIQSYLFLQLKEINKSNTGASNIISKQITHHYMMRSE